MYFSADQVSVSFKRLSSRKGKGKTHLERTSGLMYFLAFDAVCKKMGCGRLDLNPAKAEGQNNRKALELEFTKFVLLGREQGKVRHVSELGKIDFNTKDPEKRISSNFLTIPLKKASDQIGPFFYPKRPAPLMRLGHIAPGIKWGIEYHEDWSANLPKFFSEVKDSTPFTDLAIFVMRDTLMCDDAENYADALSGAIRERFSLQLAQFWEQRIKKEKVMVRHILDNLFSECHQAFGKPVLTAPTGLLDSMHKEDLISYIMHLESILDANQIEFKIPRKRSVL